MAITLDRKAYAAIGVAAIIFELMYLFWVPPWLKRSLGGVPLEDRPFIYSLERFDEVEGELGELGELGDVFDQLGKLVVDPKKKRFPVHRQELALATYIVMANRNTQYESLQNFTQANSTELVELRDRMHLTIWANLGSTLDLEKRMEGRGYVLLSDSRGGDYLDHFLAFHHEQKEFIIGIQEASSMEESIADILGPTDEFELPNNPYTGENATYTIHTNAAMMKASLRLLDKTRPILEHLVLPTDMKIVVQGHSLGGGYAALFGLAVRAYIPEHKDRIDVFAFGPAAVLDQTNALASSEFITTVVNRADIVPRLSSQSVQVLRKMLAFIDKKLNENGAIPKKSATATKLVRQVLSTKQAHIYVSSKEMEAMQIDVTEKAGADAEYQLVPPGRIIALYETEKDPSYTSTGAIILPHGSQPNLQSITIDIALFSDHALEAYIRSLNEVLDDTRTPKKSSKSTRLSKEKDDRSAGFFESLREKASVWFVPTTRLNSPFAALAIATILFIRMILATVTTGTDEASDMQLKNKAATKDQAMPKPMKKY